VDFFDVGAILVVLAALFSYLNHRYLHLPGTIGLMALALCFSILILVVGVVAPPVREFALAVLQEVDFDEALLNGMLGLLLFAGALHVDLGDLAEQKGVVAALSTVGVLISTLLGGGLAWLLINGMLGLDAPLVICLLFGALIAPTDPIAVLGILKTVGAPRTLRTKIAGESLFNDGVGVVVFLTLLGVAGLESHHAEVGALDVVRSFAQEALGGAALGFGLGWLAYRLLRTVDDYKVEILLSLALVLGGYSGAQALHVSGPIAMVVAGLLIGNHGRSFAMSDTTRVNLDLFWELVDEILNAVLFVLIGLELLILPLEGRWFLAGLLAIPGVLLGRAIAVGIPVRLLSLRREFTPHAVKVLTWGGLRGGISVALVLSLASLMPPEHAAVRDVMLVMTYCVVAFSILVQGLTMGPLLARLGLREASPE
jgi:CPA1 family monovalent cation:H+ antiporter